MINSDNHKFITTVTPYRGKHETVIKEKSKLTRVGLSNTDLYINMDYTHYVDLVDVDSDLEANEVLQIENRICEETYIAKSQLVSLSKQVENATNIDGVAEHVYFVSITAKATICNIRCKHEEEATELFQTLFNWWRHDIYPEKPDPNITA